MTKTLKISFASMLIAGMSMMGCQGDGHESSTTTTESKDSMVTDVPVNTAVNTNDSMAAKMMADSMARVNMNTPAVDSTGKMKSPAGKGKKGKISIIMGDMKSSAAMTADKDGFYTNVDSWPSFPGGQKALEDYFANNVEYPDMASSNGTQGTVQVNFGVDENGKVVSPKVMSTKVGDGIEDEALRLVKKMPSWNAGKVKGKAVKTRFTLPVRFELTD